jgi:ribosomal protein L32
MNEKLKELFKPPLVRHFNRVNRHTEKGEIVTLLKPPFFWDKGKLYLSDHTWLELHNYNEGLFGLGFIEFIRLALNEKLERDYGEPVKWKIINDGGWDYAECPKCGEEYRLECSPKEIEMNYCPNCGQWLLPQGVKE